MSYGCLWELNKYHYHNAKKYLPVFCFLRPDFFFVINKFSCIITKRNKNKGCSNILLLQTTINIIWLSKDKELAEWSSSKWRDCVQKKDYYQSLRSMVPPVTAATRRHHRRWAIPTPVFAFVFSTLVAVSSGGPRK